MTMNPALWRHLPEELVERVLLLLPVTDLSKLRRVSKTWNALINSSPFGAAYARRAAESPNMPFIAMRCVLGRTSTTHEGWCFLDLNSYKWLIVRDDQPRLHPRHNSRTSSVAFMNDGLVCRFMTPINRSAYLNQNTEGLEFAIIVYNPIGVTLKELPSVRCHLKSRSNYSTSVYPVLIPIVDNVTMTFKVFFINQHVCASFDPSMEVRQEPFMKIYNSTTNEWSTAPEPFCVATRGVGFISNTLVFKGFLYVLFDANRGYLNGVVADIASSIWRFNLATDEWEIVINIIENNLREIQLFASTDRLYRLGWKNCGGRPFKLEVCEISLPELTLTTIFSMSRDEAVALFEDDPCSESTFEVVAAAFGNSILLITKKSRAVRVLDLETRVWSWVKRSLLWQLRAGREAEDMFYFDFECCFANPITNMNLILPSSLWPQETAERLEAQRIQDAIMRRFTTAMYNPRGMVIY